MRYPQIYSVYLELVLWETADPAVTLAGFPFVNPQISVKEMYKGKLRVN